MDLVNKLTNVAFTFSLFTLPPVARFIGQLQSGVTQMREIIRAVPYTSAKLLNPYMGTFEVTYRIGYQIYTIIVDDTQVPKIAYAAFEREDDVALICTDLICSLRGPNGDFHKRDICPREILKWYFPEENTSQWDERYGKLVIIIAPNTVLSTI